jgi:aspartyl-tRNA(Asn)/glutamyl-tRNA(Gln) amidotransferase subunit B
MTQYEPVIGLEVHVQLATRSKLFCACPTGFGAPPNSQVCPVCLGHPGVLPVPNREAISLAIRMGLALGCGIAPVSVWSRKNYFYPDLPKGYQITQYDQPICTGGALAIRLGDGAEEVRRIALTRIHLEEDAGKSKHPEQSGEMHTLIDLNRAGTPLIEIVSEPDLRSAEEAVAYLMALRQLVQYTGVGDGNMEEGNFRCDANVSVRPVGQERLGSRVELKNMNSFRFVERAIRYEIERQIGELEAGDAVEQETRLWDVQAERTRPMRGKEDAQDYRYFPEPDLPPLMIDPAWIDAMRASMPELPEGRRQRFVEQYALSASDAEVLTQTRALADYFEEVARGVGDARSSANWVRGDVLARWSKGDPPVPAARLAELLVLVRDGVLSARLAKEAFEEMCETGDAPAEIVGRRGWTMVADEDALQLLVDQVLRDHPAEVAAFRDGKDKLFHFFVGQAMKVSRGQADPVRLKELLERALRG